MPTAAIDGVAHAFAQGERLIDVINRVGARVPQVCYHPQMGPIQTCDTCMVDVDGKLVRACGMPAAEGMKVATESARAQKAQHEAFDRILGNHLLYCTVFASPRSKIQRVTALSQIRSVPGRGWINKSARCAISFLRRSDTISFCPFSLCDRFTRVASTGWLSAVLLPTITTSSACSISEIEPESPP